MKISKRAWRKYAKDLGEKFEELKSSWDEDRLTEEEKLNAWNVACDTRKKIARAYERGGNEEKADYNSRLLTRNLIGRFNQIIRMKYRVDYRFS